MPNLERLPGQGLDDDEVELGFIAGFFGVGGEVRLFLHNPESGLLQSPRSVVFVDPKGSRYRARLCARPGAGRRILGRIEGFTTREHATEVKDWRFGVARSALPPIAADEFYVRDVQGAEVRVGGERIGRVTAVHDTVDGSVLEVVRLDGEICFASARDMELVRPGLVHFQPGALDEI